MAFCDKMCFLLEMERKEQDLIRGFNEGKEKMEIFLEFGMLFVKWKLNVSYLAGIDLRVSIVNLTIVNMT